jgi:hypothetical protein
VGKLAVYCIKISATDLDRHRWHVIKKDRELLPKCERHTKIMTDEITQRKTCKLRFTYNTMQLKQFLNFNLKLQTKSSCSLNLLTLLSFPEPQTSSVDSSTPQIMKSLLTPHVPTARREFPQLSHELHACWRRPYIRHSFKSHHYLSSVSSNSVLARTISKQHAFTSLQFSQQQGENSGAQCRRSCYCSVMNTRGHRLV